MKSDNKKTVMQSDMLSEQMKASYLYMMDGIQYAKSSGVSAVYNANGLHLYEGDKVSTESYIATLEPNATIDQFLDFQKKYQSRVERLERVINSPF